MKHRSVIQVLSAKEVRGSEEDYHFGRTAKCAATRDVQGCVAKVLRCAAPERCCARVEPVARLKS